MASLRGHRLSTCSGLPLATNKMGCKSAPERTRSHQGMYGTNGYVMATELEGENQVSPARKQELGCLQGLDGHVTQERKQAALPSQAEAYRLSHQGDSALPRRARPSPVLLKTPAFRSVFCFLTSDGDTDPEKHLPYQGKQQCVVDDKGQPAFLLGGQETTGRDRRGGKEGTPSPRSSPWGTSTGLDSGVLSSRFSKVS